MSRTDLSNYLVHWLKGGSNDEAFDTLRRIVLERRLLGGDGHIRGGYRCICFTEAPTTAFHQIIGRYRPFGIQVSKHWAFERGGRPAIYQPDDEFDGLSDAHKWRHVRYEPNRTPPIDFSWEREWRIQQAQLGLHPADVCILLPHDSWAYALEEEHYDNESGRIQMDAMVYGDEWLMQAPQPFQFRFSVINV